MTIKTKPTFQCDFCPRNSDEPARWFEVFSNPIRYGTQKPAGELTDDADLHACDICGPMIHDFLTGLGIKHEYVRITEEQEPFLFGRIVIP